ncbi:coiled-coil domain-containing protein 146 [Genypterus blacodes]|uniref:coiled-coil domain-containing protein 146 n=1 Tax=Genypterus blacodes TaxID=154954 RepID=UPI003F76B60D
MRQSEEQQGSGPPSQGDAKVEEQQEMEEDIPLVAMAPDASLPEEQPPVSIDVSANPVFQCLDELMFVGKISATKVSRLKASYKLLHDTLKSTQDSEIQLLGEAKRHRAKLERLQVDLQKMEEQSTTEEPDTEVSTLRKQLLQVSNELKAAEDTEYKTQYELECLWKEKQCLEKEIQVQPKPDELENRMKALQDKQEDLSKEVNQRRMEVRSLTEDVESQEMQILKEQKELEDKKQVVELKQAEKAQLIMVPDQLFKETKQISLKRENAIKKIEALDEEISGMEHQVKALDERNQSFKLKRNEAMKELEGHKEQLEACKAECRRLLKEQEINKEEEAVLMGNRGILEMKMQNIMCDRKHLYESQCVQLREKNRQMQALKRMEHVLTLATEQLENTQSIFNDLQEQIDSVPKADASIQRRMELQKEVEALKISFEKQQSVADQETKKTQQNWTIQELLRESNRFREELHNLRCLTQIKAEERGQKHRELLRAEQMKQQIQLEMREKGLVIMEHKKLSSMLQHRISQCRKVCDLIMEEKNKYVGLNQIASQTITELMEQIKVLENENEIQRSIAINKDRSLTKAHMKLSHSCKMRDKLRNDISKVTWKQRQASQECENYKMELVKLTHMMDLQEQVLLEVNKSHEATVQRRNLLGIQLLELEEVLFNYYEKVNIQEAAIAKGNMALEILEKEIRELQLATNEEKRQIHLKKREVPLKKKLEEEITMLQIELSEAKDKTLEGLNQRATYKELKGTDPSSEELVKKIEQLEMHLVEREMQLLERKLLLDQVTRLSKPIRDQVDNCQQDRVSLAKKVNELRSHLKDTNLRMMSVSAQLSVKQATALSLQQEIKDKELQMDVCQRRVEEGLPPSPEMEDEWKKMLRDKRRRQRDKEERERLAEEEERSLLPSGAYTTAEARPNAYIPQAGLLPLPKPYGALAPFKPSRPGANMRHIQKPTLKPSEG